MLEMETKRSMELDILRRRLHIKSDKSEEYIRKVESYINKKAEEVKEKTKAVSTLDLALLTVLNIAGDYLSLIEKVNRLECRSYELAARINRKIA